MWTHIWLTWHHPAVCTHSPWFQHFGMIRGASSDMPWFTPDFKRQDNNHAANIMRTYRSSRRVFWACFLSYLRGQEGPAVGGGAAAAGAVAVVRHRPLQAQLGTARCGFSCMVFCRRRQKQRASIKRVCCIHQMPRGRIRHVTIWLYWEYYYKYRKTPKTVGVHGPEHETLNDRYVSFFW